VLVILVQLVFGFVNWFVQTWFGLGLVKVYLKAARDQEPSVGDLFSVGPFFLAGLVASLLAGLAQFAGFLLLIIPGIIIALGLILLQVRHRGPGPRPHRMPQGELAAHGQ
jgi:hypothetical protein